jgi:type I restriction enzyme S subunit
MAAVSEGVRGKMLDRQRNTGELLPYLRNITVRWRSFDLTDVQLMRFEANEEERYGLRDGDVLVCEGGEPGRAAVWRGEPHGMRFQKALHRVRCNSSLLPDWLVNVLQANADSGLLSRYFTGSGIAHLTGVSLSRVPVPLPPIAEQQVLVERVEQLLAIADRIQSGVAVAENLTKRTSHAVLAKALRGGIITKVMESGLP